MLENIQALNENEIQAVSGGSGVTTNCFIYIVKKGDCLSMIAQRYGTTVTVLCQINNIANADKIYVGQRILIPIK